VRSTRGGDAHEARNRESVKQALLLGMPTVR
jgi:hypothetical protein